MIQTKILTDDVLREVITSSSTRAEAAKRLGIQTRLVSEHIKRLGISTNRALSRKRCTTAEDIRAEYLSNKRAIESCILRKLLLKTGIKEYKCELCGLTEWLGKPIPLQLHHKNGDHHDNSEDNLMIVCPTCHVHIEQSAKLDKQYRATLEQQKKRELRQFYDKYGTPPELIHSQKFECTAEELIQLFSKYKTYTGVGKYFGVTDNSVKKRCYRLGIIDKIKPIIQEGKRERAIRNKPLLTEENKEKLRLAAIAANKNRVFQSVEMLDSAGNVVRVYACAQAAAADGFFPNHIRDCCKGKRGTHKGYKWRFHEDTTVTETI